jgi:hypothetical protein
MGSSVKLQFGPPDDEENGQWETPEDVGQWETPESAALATPNLDQPEEDGPDLFGALRDLLAALTPKKALQLGLGASRALHGAELDATVGAAKGLGSTVLGLGEMGLKAKGAIKKGLTGNEEWTPPLGSTAESLGLRPEGPVQAVGFGAEQLAEFLGPAAAKLPKGIALAANAPRYLKTAAQGANLLGRSAFEGASSGVLAGAQGDDAETAAGMGASVPFVGPALRAAGKGVGRVVLSPWAERQYGKVLGATGRDLQKLSKEIVPFLLKRKLTAATQGGLLDKIEARTKDAGDVLDQAVGRVPVSTVVNTQGMLNEIETLAKRYAVKNIAGRWRAANPAAKQSIKHLYELYQSVRQTGPTWHNMRKLRQILDEQVSAGKKAFNRTVAEGSQLDATRDTANVVRRELSRHSPEVAAANKEMSSFLTADDVLRPATEKQSGERAATYGERLFRMAARTAGAGVGAAIGAATGGPFGALGGATLGGVALGKVTAVAQELMASPLWRTVSAVKKQELAELLRAGNYEAAMRFMSGLASEREGPGERLRREKEKREYFYKLRQSEKKPVEAKK